VESPVSLNFVCEQLMTQSRVYVWAGAAGSQFCPRAPRVTKTTPLLGQTQREVAVPHPVRTVGGTHCCLNTETAWSSHFEYPPTCLFCSSSGPALAQSDVQSPKFAGNTKKRKRHPKKRHQGVYQHLTPRSQSHHGPLVNKLPSIHATP